MENNFFGNFWVDNIGPGEEFDLNLGMDENVKVKGELLEKKMDETFIGSMTSANRVTFFKYKLNVENYKGKKTKVNLLEAMPVSQDDRIKVKIDKVSLEPTKKDWEDKKGIWLWNLELDSGTFSVEHSRGMQVEGL